MGSGALGGEAAQRNKNRKPVKSLLFQITPNISIVGKSYILYILFYFLHLDFDKFYLALSNKIMKIMGPLNFAPSATFIFSI